MAILDALGRGPAGVSELATATGLPKSTVARLLATLEATNAVFRPNGYTRYRLGPAIAALASAAPPGRNLVAVARPHLGDVTRQVGEAAGLSVGDGHNVHYIDQVDGPNAVQVKDWTGTRIPMHLVPSGIVLLADWPKDAVARYLATDLVQTTSRSVVEPAAIRRKLAAARSVNHSWVFEEFAEGINSVATPIRDQSGKAIAAIHIHGPAYRFPAEGEQDWLAELLVKAGARISDQLEVAD